MRICDFILVPELNAINLMIYLKTPTNAKQKHDVSLSTFFISCVNNKTGTSP